MISKNVENMIPKIQQFLEANPSRRLGSLVHAQEAKRVWIVMSIFL